MGRESDLSPGGRSSVRPTAPLSLVVVLLAGCLGRGTLNEEQCATDAEALLAEACTSCHSASLSGDARVGATEGIDFDSEADQQRHAAAIRETVLAETMPPFRPLSACDARLLLAHLDALESRECLPSCSGRRCGDDGCGGSCGSCLSPAVCSAAGTCVCLPDCDGKACGDDGCGGTCAECPDGLVCEGTACVCAPNCPAGAECGPDGCGGSCGSGCAGSLLCNTRTQRCTASCTADCTGRTCGDDGCGGSCGPCDELCTTEGQCVCAPRCAARACGDDGCGGSCGSCPGGQSCAEGDCVWDSTAFAPVFALFQRTGCASNGCHAGASPKAGLNLSTEEKAYVGMVNVASRQCTTMKMVAPGEVSRSYLINKLTGAGMCSGSIMPKADARYSQAELDLVRAWIGSGAGR